MTAEPDPKRQPDGKFGVGNSANPGGRRAWTDEDRKALEDLTPKAWRRLAQLVESEDESVAERACRQVFDRRFGQAPKAPEDTDASETAWAALMSRLVGSEPPK